MCTRACAIHASRNSRPEEDGQLADAASFGRSTWAVTIVALVAEIFASCRCALDQIVIARLRQWRWPLTSSANSITDASAVQRSVKAQIVAAERVVAVARVARFIAPQFLGRRV